MLASRQAYISCKCPLSSQQNYTRLNDAQTVSKLISTDIILSLLFNGFTRDTGAAIFQPLSYKIIKLEMHGKV